MEFYHHPDAYSELRCLYWSLRNCRSYNQAKRRRYYRYIRRERERLVAAGHAAEHVRLYCRWMSEPLRQSSERRLLEYERAVVEYSRVLGRVRGLDCPVPVSVAPGCVTVQV